MKPGPVNGTFGISQLEGAMPETAVQKYGRCQKKHLAAMKFFGNEQ
jgi:hypothetical protein